MPQEIWPTAVNNACFDTWQDTTEGLDREAEIDAFGERWGGFGAASLKRMAQQGNKTERLFALFALGYLALPVEEGFFTPFLSSPERKERWASAIALGRQQDPCVFLTLQRLLLEEIEYHPLYDNDTRNRVQEAVRKAMEHANHLWECQADPTLVEIWRKDLEDQEEYRWFTIHRMTITRLLAEWKDPRVIPTLRHVLHTCEKLEQHAEFWENPLDALIGWSNFLDLLRKTLDDLTRKDSSNNALFLTHVRVKLAFRSRH